MTTTRLDRRYRRRELHRSRSTAMNVFLVLVILVAAWVGTEAVLAAAGQGPLVASPRQLLTTALHPSAAELPYVVAGVIVAAVLGIVAVVLALAPGRKARKAIASERGAILVDDGLLASGLSRAARTEPGAGGASIRTTVGARSALVSVQPVSGLPIDESALTERLREHLTELGLDRRLRVRADVSATGRIDR